MVGNESGDEMYKKPEAKYTLHKMVMILLIIWQGSTECCCKSKVSNTMVKEGLTEMVTFKETF